MAVTTVTLLPSVTLESQGDGESWGPWSLPPDSQSPSYSRLGLDCRPWDWAPFFPSLPFLLHRLVSASDCIPRPCSKVPGSDLPWGGSGERVRLVNSAGLSRGWEGALGT